MEYLAHRGLWKERGERNTLDALFKALDGGYGLETDVRDLDGRLVVSHDMPRTGSAVDLEALFEYYAKGGHDSTLAINVKADGLQEPLKRLLGEYGIRSYFVFDMSVPDTLGYLSGGFRVFARKSELESHPELEMGACGVWLDELTRPWIDAGTVAREVAKTQGLCIVSGELHGRPNAAQWGFIKAALESGAASDRLMLCTDLPEEAERYFR